MGFGISFAIGFSSRGGAEHRHPASSGIIRTQEEPEIRNVCRLKDEVESESISGSQMPSAFHQAEARSIGIPHLPG